MRDLIDRETQGVRVAIRSPGNWSKHFFRRDSAVSSATNADLLAFL
jgi:hypothetical protein